MNRAIKGLMLFSFAYGGFLLLAFLGQVYFVVWRHQFLLPGGPTGTPSFIGNRSFARLPSVDPAGAMLSPQSLFALVTSLAFLANGFFLWRLDNEKNRADAKQEVYSHVLTEDERMAYDAIRKAGGSLTQKELSLKTGFSPVHTHRIVARLKGKGAIAVHPFGMTNKLVAR